MIQEALRTENENSITPRQRNRGRQGLETPASPGHLELQGPLIYNPAFGVCGGWSSSHIARDSLQRDISEENDTLLDHSEELLCCKTTQRSVASGTVHCWSSMRPTHPPWSRERDSPGSLRVMEPLSHATSLDEAVTVL